jgi:hypothetical protein
LRPAVRGDRRLLPYGWGVVTTFAAEVRMLSSGVCNLFVWGGRVMVTPSLRVTHRI